MASATLEKPVNPLLANATDEQAGTLLATGKVQPADFAAWMAGKRGASSLAAVGLKVGPAGTLVFTGFGRRPVTLYVEQYYRLLAKVADTETFITTYLDAPFEGIKKDENGNAVAKFAHPLKTKDRSRCDEYRKTALEAVVSFAESMVDGNGKPSK